MRSIYWLAVSGAVLGSCAALVAFSGAAVASEDSQEGNTVTYQGVAVTGLNRRLGVPIANYVAPIGTNGFTHVAGFNSAGSTPIPLVPGAQNNTVLATVLDPAQIAFLGVPLASVDASLANMRLADVATNVDPALVNRATLPGLLSAAQDATAEAEPALPITLGAWLQAEGRATFRCTQHGNSVDVRVKNLIPNRVYSVWAVFGGASAAGRPLGGVPNVISTDSSGNGELKRALNFCPFRPKAGERPLVNLQILYHSDNQSYGGVAQPHLDGRSHVPGFVSHTQLEIPISVLN